MTWEPRFSEHVRWDILRRAGNPLWYQAYLCSKHWRTLREKRLKKDDYRCSKCGFPYRLQVHHRTYKRLGRERLTDIITLCRRCHEEVHGG
jgi:5-methylcytosine-specific restriction endonuclease McrA